MTHHIFCDLNYTSLRQLGTLQLQLKSSVLLRQRLEQRHQSLGDILMQVAELRRHVGETRQAVGVQILVAHLQHVVLNRSDDHKDEQTAEGDFRYASLSVPLDVLQHDLVHGLVEAVVLGENQQHDQRHVDVMRAAVGRVIENLEDWDD